MAGKKWNQEEIDFIKTNGIKMSCREMSQYLPGRTPRAIEHIFNKFDIGSQRPEPKIGDKFERLTIQEIYVQKEETQNKSIVICLCECGNIVKTRLTSLVQNHTKSCGCLKNEKAAERASKLSYKHGLCKNNMEDPIVKKLMSIWNGIKIRCYRSNAVGYHRYGGAGIVMCDEWKDSFETFYNWAIQKGFKLGLSIHRVNNSKIYGPDCEWITQKEQCRNKTNNIVITAFGETKCLQEWLEDERCKVKNGNILKYRIEHKWEPEKAIIILSQTENVLPKCNKYIIKSRWKSMINRCYNPKNLRYKNYGARGIKVDLEWRGKAGFDNFYNWFILELGDKNINQYSIDRINNDGPYSKENCKLSLRKEQMINRTINKWITAWGETKTRMNWLRDPRCGGICHATLVRRLENNWKPEDAISFPPLTQRKAGYQEN